MTALTTLVLVLNKDWAPLRVVEGAKALGYLVRGVAEAIDVDSTGFPTHGFESWEELSELRAAFEPDRHTFVRTVRNRLLVPVIVRMTRYDKRRRHRARLNRRNIFARDKTTCQYCGRKPPSIELNIDHVVPRCQGGTSTWSNLVCSCVACNTRKAGRTPEQAQMRLIREPQQVPYAHDVPRIRHDSWKHFVDDLYWQVDLID